MRETGKGGKGERRKDRAGFSFLLLAVSLPLLLSSAPAHAQATPNTLTQRIERLLDHPDFADAFWGVHIEHLQTGEVIYSRHADKRFIPASNQKVFTTAAALSILGPDFRYQTRLYLDGPVRGDTLYGDLVIRGAGDPTFGSERYEEAPGVFSQWADSLALLGIKHIEGDVIGDDDVFDDVPYGLGWAWDDLSFAYAAETSGLTFREGTVELTVRGTRPGLPARISWEPLMTPYVEVVNRSLTEPRGRAVDEGYARALSGNRLVVTTTVPAGGRDTERIAVHNPTLYTAHTFRLALLSRGIGVEGSAADADGLSQPLDYTLMRPAASALSPPLAEMAVETNRRSNNLYAEHLLRTVGAHSPPSDGESSEPGSAAAGAEAMASLLQNAGIDPESLQLTDGSGLSFMNRVTPRSLVRLLTYLHRTAESAVRDAFYHSLPVGGQSGTLARRFRRGAAHGNVRAKTGYINNVRALSGYVTDARGHRMVFSIIANGYSASTRRVTAAQDAIVELLADYEGR